MSSPHPAVARARQMFHVIPLTVTAWRQQFSVIPPMPVRYRGQWQYKDGTLRLIDHYKETTA